MGSDESGTPLPHSRQVLAASTCWGAWKSLLRPSSGGVSTPSGHLWRLKGKQCCVCVLPIPRYVMKPCCTDTRGEGDFEEILMSGTETCRRVVGVEGAKACLSIFTFNPIAWSASQGPRSDRGRGRGWISNRSYPYKTSDGNGTKKL